MGGKHESGNEALRQSKPEVPPQRDPNEGGPKIKKKDQGSIFFELTPVLGLTKYVSGHLFHPNHIW